MNQGANIFDASQREMRNIVLGALREQASGYLDRMNKNGQKLMIVPHTIFYEVGINGVNSIEPFAAPVAANNRFQGNWTQTTLPQDKIFVAAGLRLQTCEGQTSITHNAATQVFGTPTVAPVLNSLVTLEFGTKKLLDNQKVQDLVINDDSIPDFARFPELRVLNENSELRLQHTLPAVYAALSGSNGVLVRYALPGFMVQRATI